MFEVSVLDDLAEAPVKSNSRLSLTTPSADGSRAGRSLADALGHSDKELRIENLTQGSTKVLDTSTRVRAMLGQSYLCVDGEGKASLVRNVVPIKFGCHPS